jgi:hypothetical protein
MGSPVCGLRPMRAFRLDFTRRPRPGITNTPFFLVSLIAVSASVSRNVARSCCSFPVSPPCGGQLGLGHACCHLSSLKIEHLRRNMSTFCCTHWVYYISKGSMQAFSPDFMRLFLRSLWKTGINSGDNRLHTLAPIETQDGVTLPQRAMPPQGTKFISGIKVLVVFGNHLAFRGQQLATATEIPSTCS